MALEFDPAVPVAALPWPLPTIPPPPGTLLLAPLPVGAAAPVPEPEPGTADELVVESPVVPVPAAPVPFGFASHPVAAANSAAEIANS